MMKKIILLCVLTCLICVCLASPIHALDVVEANGYVEEDRVLAIERLNMERSRLCHDIEANCDAIQRIDYQLGILGVEELTAENFPNIEEGSAEIQRTVPSTNYHVKWITWRTIYVYYGTQYEIQVIRAVSNADNDRYMYPVVYDSDPLKDTDSFGVKDETGYGWDVAIMEGIEFTGKYIGETFYEGVADATEKVYPKSAILFGLIDAHFYREELGELIAYNLSSTTELLNTSITCTYSLVAAEEYIYVKMPGYEDEGHQICAYIGNQVECAAGVQGATFEIVGSEWKPLVIQDVENVVFSSPNFDGRHQFAVENFLRHRNGNSIVTNYLSFAFNLTIQGHLVSRTDITKEVPVPYIRNYSLF